MKKWTAIIALFLVENIVGGLAMFGLAAFVSLFNVEVMRWLINHPRLLYFGCMVVGFNIMCIYRWCVVKYTCGRWLKKLEEIKEEIKDIRSTT